MRRARNRAAFTLVELLVVIGIIAILAGMLMPAIMAARTRAHESSTLNLIHQCEVAATGFFNDYGDYPPSTWEEYFALVEYDYDGNGTFEGAEDGDDDFPDLDTWPAGDPRDSNEGIEVFVAAVATRTGGPYMEPGGDQLGNTDRDEDGDPDSDGDYETASASNWFFGGEPSPLFELVDFWGNPLVYVHNRDYAVADGVLEEAGDGDPICEDPFDPPAPGSAGDPNEGAMYADAQGNPRACYARSRYHTTTMTYPNLNRFQLYSWGKDLMPGRRVSFKREDPEYPGWTAGSGTGAEDELRDSGSDSDPTTDGWDWVPGDGNLCNWEE